MSQRNRLEPFSVISGSTVDDVVEGISGFDISCVGVGVDGITLFKGIFFGWVRTACCCCTIDCWVAETCGAWTNEVAVVSIDGFIIGLTNLGGMVGWLLASTSASSDVIWVRTRASCGLAAYRVGWLVGGESRIGPWLTEIYCKLSVKILIIDLIVGPKV